MKPEKYAKITISLIQKNLIADYATDYRIHHDSIAGPRVFRLSDSDYSDFVAWVSKKQYEYTTRSEKILDELKASAEKEKYYNAIQNEYDAMKKTLMHDKDNDLVKEKKQIRSILEEEIASRYYLNPGRIQASFKDDTEIKKAIEVLDDDKRMKELLTQTPVHPKSDSPVDEDDDE
jgi:carboxyl-terminal processing protease